MQRHRIGTTRVLFAPLRNYGDFTWYDPPTDEVPHGIRLVVCDGPPGSTPGGRYGLLPVLGDRLDPGAVVLLDDAERATETHVLERWRAERALEVQHFRPSRSGYAVITL